MASPFQDRYWSTLPCRFLREGPMGSAKILGSSTGTSAFVWSLVYFGIFSDSFFCTELRGLGWGQLPSLLDCKYVFPYRKVVSCTTIDIFHIFNYSRRYNYFNTLYIVNVNRWVHVQVGSESNLRNHHNSNNVRSSLACGRQFFLHILNARIVYLLRSGKKHLYRRALLQLILHCRLPAVATNATSLLPFDVVIWVFLNVLYLWYAIFQLSSGGDVDLNGNKKLHITHKLCVTFLQMSNIVSIPDCQSSIPALKKFWWSGTHFIRVTRPAA